MEGYLLNLRQQVGKRPLVVAGVVGLVVESGNILLVRRNDNDLWGLPAGSIELYESPHTAICRELYEETGLRALETDIKLINVFGGDNFSYTYPNGDECSFVSISFLIKNFAGTIVTKTDETNDCRFFPLDKLPDSIVKHELIQINDFVNKNQI